MARFNLVDEPWIPCTVRRQPRLLGLRDVLRRAREIEEIADASPLTTVAIYRLLLAILHRVVGPRRDGDWEELWRAGGWGRESVDTYLATWRQRFDLLDPIHPFYQNPHIEADWSYAQRLTLELGPANAAMFSHVSEDAPITLSLPQAARYLLAYQLFSPGGLVGLQKHEDREDRVRFKYARAAPLAGTAVCLLTGRSLAESLLLNMVAYDPDARPGRPFPSEPNDRPLWERDEPPEVVERRPTGLVDWLTWACRRIRLRATEINRTVVVDGVLIMKGMQLPSDAYEFEYEQMVAYRVVPEPTSTQSPFPPVGFQRDRAIWRDSAALIQSAEPAGKERGRRRPRTLDAVANRSLGADDDWETGTGALPLDLFGINLDQFNVLFWRHERLPIPPAYLDDPSLYAGLQQALGYAESGARTLTGASRRLAELLLSPDSARKPDPKAVAALAESMGVTRRYWPRLGPDFSRFLLEQPTTERAALHAWADEVTHAARAAFGEVARGQTGAGWSLKARVEAERSLNIGLSRARKELIGDPEEVLHATS